MAPTSSNSNVVAAVSNKMKLERMLSMKGGKGEGSYLNNSQAQAQHARSVLHLLTETLDGIHLQAATTTFVVADLGCSCGENTIQAVNAIVNHMTKRYGACQGGGSPDFMAYFSDLPSNDFNTLFQLLPPYGGGDTMEECLKAADGGRGYFVAAAPGSFYRRLFPEKYVDVFYSAFSLHWLSQVPEVVLDKRSGAYNKGRIFIDGADEMTANAYKKQFEMDLASFLGSRSKEMKGGGSMFLVCLGRTCSDPRHQGGAGLLFGAHFQDAWDDLVQEGLISSEKRDNFNIPVFAPTLDEFKQVVESDTSFVINKLEVFRGGSPLVVNNPNDPKEIGRALSNTCRSVSGVLVEAHIGDQLSQELFLRVAKRATTNANELLDKLQFFHIVASLSLAAHGRSG